MRRLTGFELGKLLRNKILWVLMAVLLAVNIIDVWSPWEEPYPYKLFHGETAPFFKEFVTWSPEEQAEARAYLQEVYDEVYRVGGTTEEQLQGGSGRYLSTQAKDFSAASSLESYERRNQERLEARRKIVESAKRLGLDALASGDDYNVRRNLEIVKTYSVEPVMSLFPERGWEKYFTYGFYDILVLLLIVGAVAVCFSNEKETGAALLISASKNGRGKTAAAKAVAAGLFALGLSVFFSLANLLFFYIKFGMWDVLHPLIELESFVYTQLFVSAIQYLGIFILFKAFGAVVFALLVCMISALCGSNLKAYAIAALFLGLSYGYSYLISGPAVPEFFHLIDVTLFTRPIDYFGNYHSANLFTYPVQWYWVHLAFWSLIAVAASVVMVRAYTGKPRSIK